MAVLMMNARRRKSRKRVGGRKRRRRNPVVSTNARPRRRRAGGGTSWNMMNIVTGAGAAVIGGVAARYLSKMILKTRDVGPMGYLANGGIALGMGLLGMRFMKGKAAKQLAALTAVGGLTATGLRFINDKVLRGQLAGPGLSAYIPAEEVPLLGLGQDIDIDLDEDVPEFGEYVADDDLNI